MEKTIYENESTPKADGFHMPGEHEPKSASGCFGLIEPTTGNTGQNPHSKFSPTWRAPLPTSNP